jgi:hypothetical protein
MMYKLPTLVLLFLVPASALAYLTPEEMLLQEQGQYFAGSTTYYPPNRRRVDVLDQQMQQQRAQQHPNTIVDPNMEGYVAPASASSTAGKPAATAPTTTLNPAAPGLSIPLDATTVRLLQRIERGTLRTNSFIQSQTRPLAPSGAGALLTVIVMALAVGWTLIRARKSKGWHLK